MSPNGWFRRKPAFSSRAAGEKAEAIPDGLWVRCPQCNEILFNKELEKNLKVCKKCGHHFRLTLDERISMLLDEDSFVAIEDTLRTANPLGFPDYDATVERWTKKTGLRDGMVIGRGALQGHPLCLGIAAFAFGGGSMGSIYGERVVRILEIGLAEGLPVVMLCASGGARMHEGILSLMQMAKTSAAVARLRDAGIPYITVLTDPTTAGVMASFASLGDVILAEPGALIGFAGARVAKKVQVEKPPDNYQTAEFQLESGMLDMVVHRKELRATLGRILSFAGSPVSPSFVETANGAGEISEGVPVDA